jgi:putative glutamine amidotransferase
VAPVIGVTATLKEDIEHEDGRPLGRYTRADLDYVAGVAEAGGAPVVLPPVPGVSVDALLRGIDGLLLSGGSDLDPGYYGEEPSPELGPTIPERDEFEVALLRGALDRGLPVFGICRGLQVMNVVLGGSLYQDLPTELPDGSIAHRQAAPKWQWTHEVRAYGGSALAGILGTGGLKVNSYHHQAIKDLADGLVVSARSTDGVVEAVEYRDLSERWLVGVQWHAEAMRDAARDPDDSGRAHRNLFAAHVAAASRVALRRAAA